MLAEKNPKEFHFSSTEQPKIRMRCWEAEWGKKSAKFYASRTRKLWKSARNFTNPKFSTMPTPPTTATTENLYLYSYLHSYFRAKYENKSITPRKSENAPETHSKRRIGKTETSQIRHPSQNAPAHSPKKLHLLYSSINIHQHTHYAPTFFEVGNT